MILEIHLKLCVTKPGFLKKNFCAYRLDQNEQKVAFFEVIEKSGHQF